VHSKLLPVSAKMDFAVITDFDPQATIAAWVAARVLTD